MMMMISVKIIVFDLNGFEVLHVGDCTLLGVCVVTLSKL